MNQTYTFNLDDFIKAAAIITNGSESNKASIQQA